MTAITMAAIGTRRDMDIIPLPGEILTDGSAKSQPMSPAAWPFDIQQVGHLRRSYLLYEDSYNGMERDVVNLRLPIERTGYRPGAVGSRRSVMNDERPSCGVCALDRVTA